MLIPFGEWTPDRPDAANTAVDAKNVIPELTGYRSFPSTIVSSEAVPGKPIGAISVTDADGNGYNYVGDASAIYTLVSGTWNDISWSATSYATGTTERWEFTKFYEQVVATNYSNPIQTITLGGTNFDTLSSDAPRARYLTVVNNFLIVANTYDGADGNQPHRVWWPAIGLPSSWPTPGTAAAISVLSDYQNLPGNDGFIMGLAGGEYGVVFQERGITRMTFAGTPLIFQFDKIENARGTPARGSIAQLGHLVFYLGQDGFYLFDGVQSTPIGREKVDRTFWADVDVSFLGNITSAIDPANTLVLWAYPGAGNTNGRPNKLLMFNWNLQRWSRVELDTWLIYWALTTGYTLEQLDDFSSSIDALQFSLDSRFWTGGELQFSCFDSSYRLTSFAGTAMDAILETQEVNVKHARSFLRALRPLVEHAGEASVTIQVGTRNNLHSNATFLGSVSANDSGITPVRATGRYMRFRLNTSGDFDHALGIEIKEGDWSEDSER